MNFVGLRVPEIDLRALRHLTALAHDAEVQQNARDAQQQDLGELDRDVIRGILLRQRQLCRPVF